MTQADYSRDTTQKLVERFEQICLKQSEAMRHRKSGAYNIWFDQMLPLEGELKRRNQRDALASLYDHADPQVRYQAAVATLIVFPEQARAVLQAISDRDEWPSDMEARSMLRALDDGSFDPS